MPYGYAGRVLHIDLTTGEQRIEEPPRPLPQYMGGSGLDWLIC